ncbi:hypothetical protein DS901_09735 [Loktanella sp. D2R18]|uniref:hypothetical protein n=1 Tax=Rhodobacterales TaxID=204455 RepID=UPI000DE91917|nr:MULTISPECIES: hypothetical protein [Rhodobacterales]MDO6591455.1 hypothetical protein [Yoonia sp. 1_MG-2023]RBW43480.1 hypothetical protein DS901_09735 [Loktanella sp. D2R18]
MNTKSITALLLCLTAACSSSGTSPETETPSTSDVTKVAGQSIVLDPGLVTSTRTAHISADDFSDYFDQVDEKNVDLELINSRAHSLILSDTQNKASVYSFVGYGIEDGEAVFFAYSGLRNNTPLATSTPDSGIVTFNTAYEIEEITNITTDPHGITTTTGRMDLDVDFGNNTISGGNDLFTVDGTAGSAGNNSDQFIDADITWRGADGNLYGLVTGSDLLGSFSGGDENIVYSGVITGSPDSE